MVLYFLNQTDGTEEYLGTIQTFFLVNSIYMAIFRFVNGIIDSNHLLPIACGMLGIALGQVVASKIVSKIDGQMLRKVTYVTIGISGIINLF